MTSAVGLTHAGGGTLGVPSPMGDQTPPQVGRAKLKLQTAVPAPGGAKPGGDIGSIEFQFNPKELTIAKTAKWERKAAKGSKKAGPPEYQGPQPCKLSLEMFLDCTGKQDASVVKAVEQLFSCCVPTDASLDKKKPQPPLVTFTWGQITSFPGFITSVNAKYTLFASDGTPIRATCAITLEEMPGGNGGTNPTSGSITARRVHRVITSDTLASLAYGEYGDPGMWRLLARYNGIDDPLRLTAGSVLLLPDPEELSVTPPGEKTWGATS